MIAGSCLSNLLITVVIYLSCVSTHASSLIDYDFRLGIGAGNYLPSQKTYRLGESGVAVLTNDQVILNSFIEWRLNPIFSIEVENKILPEQAAVKNPGGKSNRVSGTVIGFNLREVLPYKVLHGYWPSTWPSSEIMLGLSIFSHQGFGKMKLNEKGESILIDTDSNTIMFGGGLEYLFNEYIGMRLSASLYIYSLAEEIEDGFSVYRNHAFGTKELNVFYLF